MRRAETDIAAHLAQGLPLDTGSLASILEALGEADPARAFARLAADPEASEHAPLLALALSPGQASRRALEPALALAGLDADGARELAKRVARRVTDGVTLLLPDGSRLAPRLPAPELAARAQDFVRRLRPEATPPPELRRILAERFAGARAELGLDLAVALRHCRLEWSPGRVFFVAALLERSQKQDDLAALVAWAAWFLALSGPDFEPRQALRRRRQALVSQLRQAEAQEEAQEGASFEVRMSQGQRSGHVHGPDLRAELALLDRACLLVLGVPGEALDANIRDLGQAVDAQELLRLFSE
jgi:hypothetical protein